MEPGQSLVELQVAKYSVHSYIIFVIINYCGRRTVPCGTPVSDDIKLHIKSSFATFHSFCQCQFLNLVGPKAVGKVCIA